MASEDAGEIMSKSVASNRGKRINLFLKSNQHGHFVKVSESGPRGASRVIIPWSGVEDFANCIRELVDEMARIPQQPQGKDAENLASRTLMIETKRYFLDLRHNANGFFLKIAQVMQRDRSVVVIPQESMQGMADALDEMYATSGVGPEEPRGLGDNVVAAERKHFYFSVQTNDNGTFMRITEVSDRCAPHTAGPSPGPAPPSARAGPPAADAAPLVPSCAAPAAAAPSPCPRRRGPTSRASLPT